jgi:hypothetical protein
MTSLTSRAIKVTVVLNSAEVAKALAPLQTTERRIPLQFTVEGRTLAADFSPKAIRRAYATIREHGPEGVAVIVQGKLLRDDTIAEAGLVAQVKQPRPAAETVAA